MRQHDYDVAILGGGSAGYAAARTAAAAGLKTIVIEGGQEVGGLCILRGCMPTKALLYASEVMHLAQHAGIWGVHTREVRFNFTEVMARKDALIREFADFRRHQLSDGRFEFLRARARFHDPHTVELSCEALTPSLSPSDGERVAGRPGEGRYLTAAHFVIATGSLVAPPPLPHLRDVGYLTSDDALSLRILPRSLIVLGGGGVAVEFAQFLARFGVKISLIQRSPHLLKECDDDASRTIEDVFRHEGIELFTNTKLTGARRADGLKAVSFEHNGQPASVAAEEILFALGRVPNTASLDLDRAGVVTQGGRIVANEFMQTSVPHIYTAGDCTGPHEIVHIAVQQGEIAAYNIAHPQARRRTDDRLLITIVFTEPQVASVGLTEKEADRRGVPFLSASYPFGDHGKSLIMEAKAGFVKLLADPMNGEILGGACVGPLGGELIHEIVAAMAKRMTVHELAAMPHYHPTLAEIWSYPAEELAGRITRPGN